MWSKQRIDLIYYLSDAVFDLLQMAQTIDPGETDTLVREADEFLVLRSMLINPEPVNSEIVIH